jgi:glucoamylase
VAVLRPGQRLRVCLCEPAVVHCGTDGWQQVADIPTRESGLGIHVADIQTAPLGEGQGVNMTFFWTRSNRWEGRDYAVKIRKGAGS